MRLVPLFVVLLIVQQVQAQAPKQQSSADDHVAAAKAAAGQDYRALFDRLCTAPSPSPAPSAAATATPTTVRPSGPPPRETWHAEPVKVFDNLYSSVRRSIRRGPSRHRAASS